MWQVSSPLPQTQADWRAIVDLVSRAQSRLHAAVEATGVAAPWFAVLELLLRAEEHRLPMSQIAREVSFTTGGFTKLADRMGREGLIDRRGSSGDRRVVYATLTDKGVEAALAAQRAYDAAFTEYVLGVIDASGLQSVASALGGLSKVEPALEAEPEAVDGSEARDPALPDRRSR